MGDAASSVPVGGESAVLVDCRGQLCPVPIIKLSKAVKSVQVGQLVKMIATDPGSMPDMKAWEKQTGNVIVSSSHQGKEFEFVVRRTK
jgi:tRNA 2-thiouridine synthesizing protein A